MTMTIITPALTPKQWDANDPASVGPRRTLDSATALFGADCLHPLAALCLHGQPFGVTQEDVSLVRFAGAALTRFGNLLGAGPPPEIERFEQLAAKLAALLPPPA